STPTPSRPRCASRGPRSTDPPSRASRPDTWPGSCSWVSRRGRRRDSAASCRRRGEGGVRTRPISEVSSRELRPLLEAESRHWGRELLWDYSDVSSAVASGLDRKALTGRVAQEGPRALAYCYYMLDAGRAIVGSVYAAAPFRGQGLEETLLDAVLAEAQSDLG